MSPTKKRYTITSWVAVVLWMSLIFYLSHQPATKSSELSTGVMMVILATFDKITPFIDGDSEGFHFFIRKGAHFSAYFMLGIFVVHALKGSRIKGVRGVVFALGICVLYAISDETHQLFIPGRSGELRDVLIDGAGSLVGIGVYMLIMRWIRQMRFKN